MQIESERLAFQGDGAICEVAIRSIQSSPSQRSVILTHVSAERNASHPPL